MRFENPVLMKEIKTKLRPRQPRVVLMGVTVIALGFVVWMYDYAIQFLLGGVGGSRDTGWNVSVGVLSVLIWLLAPAVAANAITQEKEQQTWEMLVFTRLRPAEIISGKLLARLIPLAILGALFAPFMFMCLAMGPVSPLRAIASVLVMAVWTVFLAVTGLFGSWALRRTAAAMALAYTVVFVLVIGTMLIHATLTIGSGWEESVFIWLNPGRAAQALMDPGDSYRVVVLVFQTAVLTTATGLMLWRMMVRTATRR